MNPSEVHAPGNLHAHDNTFHNSFITRCEELAERISADPEKVTCPACVTATTIGERDSDHGAPGELEESAGQAALF